MIVRRFMMCLLYAYTLIMRRARSASIAVQRHSSSLSPRAPMQSKGLDRPVWCFPHRLLKPRRHPALPHFRLIRLIRLIRRPQCDSDSHATSHRRTPGLSISQLLDDGRRIGLSHPLPFAPWPLAPVPLVFSPASRRYLRWSCK